MEDKDTWTFDKDITDYWKGGDTYSRGTYVASDAVNAANAALQAQMANKPGAYQSQWQQQLSDTINKITNRDKFSYDVNGDALYQQYKDKFIQQGKMASADVMGQAAAMTGGYGNSYAATVGNQAYQAHLNNLNDVIPELYQMAYDRYKQEGQDLYNQYSLFADRDNTDYGRYRDTVGDWQTDRNFLANRFDTERNFDYGVFNDSENAAQAQFNTDRNFAYGQYTDDMNLAYTDYRNGIADAQWQANYDFAKLQYDNSMKDAGYEIVNGEYIPPKTEDTNTGADTLWYPTGTYDDNGNPVFRNSEGKTMSFGEGVNPYTGGKHPDAKYGTFSNGYQPNNIGGTKLQNSGMSTDVTGKNQTIWEANGKYWLWRGDLNRYVEVDVSDIKDETESEPKPKTKSGNGGYRAGNTTYMIN